MVNKQPPQEIPQDQVAVWGRVAVAAIIAIARRVAFKRLIRQLDSRLGRFTSLFFYILLARELPCIISLFPWKSNR